MERRWYLGGLLAVFMIGSGLLLWRQERLASQPNPMEARLNDGGRLRILKASLGTRHVLPYGRWPALDPWRRRFTLLTNLVGSPTDQLVMASERAAICLFIVGVRPDGTVNPNPMWARASVDEHGCAVGSLHSRGSSVFRGTNLCTQMLEVYPRRQRSFEVQFGSYQRSTNDVSIRVKNPEPWTGVEWTPATAPIRATNGELQVVFEGWGGSARWPVPKLAVEFGGRPTTDWEPYVKWFSDVSGNRSGAPDLCRHEPAWRLTGRFARKPNAPLGPENSWTLFEGELPGDGEAIALGGTNVMEGVQVEAVALGGKGVVRLESMGGWHVTSMTNLVDDSQGNSMSTGNDGKQDVVESTTTKPWAALVLNGLTPDHHWQLAVFDEQGQHLVNLGWSGSGGRLYACELQPFPESRRGRLQLTVQRFKDVEFLVEPPAPERPGSGFR